MFRAVAVSIFCAVALGVTAPTGHARSIEQDAKAFGSLPAAWYPQLSPSGRFASFLSMHASDIPMLLVFDLEKGSVSTPIASNPGVQDLNWCRWATEERLICGFYGVDEQVHLRFPLTRLIAVDRDGGDMRNLIRQSRQIQDTVIDYLYDDPKRILVPYEEEAGAKNSFAPLGVAALDIETTRNKWVKRPRESFSHWMTDGTGELRVRTREEPYEWTFEARAVDSSDWKEVGSQSKTEYLGVEGIPEGFLADRNDLVVRRRVNGREALWVIDLSGEAAPKPLFEHDEVDVGGLVTMGKERRAVGVSYSTDRRYVGYFDERIREIVERVQKTFPDTEINVFSESWDRRYYIVLTSSDQDSGAFYRLDSKDWGLIKLRDRYPELKGVELGRMRDFRYDARDGVSVPAYVTLPPGKLKKSLPTIVLPHGGFDLWDEYGFKRQFGSFESRDEHGFNWLAQFLAARGYLVVQANYRGSGGYGLDWQGKGAYKDWRLAMNDIEDGVAKLVEKGVADPDRICAVGWGYGGYAALMSSILHPERYRCVVSIGGETDLKQLIEDRENFTVRRIQRDRVGTDDGVRRAGSPLQRVDEINAPVLLFHGDDDVNVYYEHSKRLDKAMKKKKKKVEFVLYEGTEHSLDRNAARIDMLTRIGHFLEEHLAPADSAENKD